MRCNCMNSKNFYPWDSGLGAQNSILKEFKRKAAAVGVCDETFDGCETVLELVVQLALV